jgi:3-oxoacyl-[acyl-carrier protein] reductase
LSTTATPHAHAEVLSGRRLDGKSALVTGGDGQLGRRVATALGGLGAAVAIAHRGNHRDVVKDTLSSLDGDQPAGIELQTERYDAAGVAALFDRAIGGFGRLDVVVHTPGRVTKTPLAEIGDEEFEASIDANLRAAFYVLREAARRLADGGRIITLTTSITGVTIPGYSIYAGHKAATEHYVRALAKELGPRGITVNAIAPGPINSPFYFGAETEQSFQFASRMSGAGRLGEWDEIVPMIAFLCSADAQWTSAQTIRVNGGMTA